MGSLAGTDAADQSNVLPHQLEQRLNLRKDLVLAPHHNGQRTGFGADFAARYRRVKIVAAQRLDPGRELLCLNRRYRTHVDDNLAFGEPLCRSVPAEQNLSDIRRIWHHDEKDIAGCRDVLAGGALDQAIGDQVRRQILSAVSENLMTGGNQMPCHRRAHDAESDEAQFTHDLLRPYWFLRFVKFRPPVFQLRKPSFCLSQRCNSADVVRYWTMCLRRNVSRALSTAEA
jgi:hypothetical protein